METKTPLTGRESVSWRVLSSRLVIEHLSGTSLMKQGMQLALRFKTPSMLQDAHSYTPSCQQVCFPLSSGFNRPILTTQPVRFVASFPFRRPVKRFYIQVQVRFGGLFSRFASHPNKKLNKSHKEHIADTINMSKESLKLVRVSQTTRLIS